MTSFDLLVHGGALIDGTGSPPRAADIGIRGDRIEAVGRLSDADAPRTIDAAGLVIAPGFIDPHTHSDLTLIRDGAGQSKVRQGVTTEVVGNCGFSVFPIEAQRTGPLLDLLRGIDDAPVEPTWSDFAGYAAAVEASHPALNLAAFVGHGSLRVAAMGLEDRTPGDEELLTMRTSLETALEQGALGLSTGLTYVPSGFGRPEEIHLLAEVVARHERLYASHPRGGAPEDSIGEAIEVARVADVAVQYSHIALNNPEDWGRAEQVANLFDLARADGLDVAFDVYPYDASSSSLTQHLPGWVQVGGEGAMAERLSDEAVRMRAEAELAAGWSGIPWRWERVVVSGGVDEHELIGRSIADIARSRDVSPAALTLELCARHGNLVRIVLFSRSERDMETFLRHPLALVGSDGYAMAPNEGSAKPHPRSFGTYPRVLGRYVRERRTLALEEAVQKMTFVVARRLGLLDRGEVRPGLAADLVVFDAGAIRDLATYDDPWRFPEGVVHVVVNGRVVVERGIQTSERPGRVLRGAGA